MWDPTCLISPACEETKSVYPLSTPPTPLLDEAMSVSPQKSSPAKERLQTVTEEVEVVKEVTVKKEGPVSLRPPRAGAGASQDHFPCHCQAQVLSSRCQTFPRHYQAQSYPS